MAYEDYDEERYDPTAPMSEEDKKQERDELYLDIFGALIYQMNETRSMQGRGPVSLVSQGTLYDVFEKVMSSD